jgi:hypothetical protein
MERLEEICKENREKEPVFSDKYVVGYELKVKLQLCEGCKNYVGFGGFNYCYLRRLK